MQTQKKNSASSEQEQQIWSWLADVPDPEIPVLSVLDLGIIRDVVVREDSVEVSVAPTY